MIALCDDLIADLVLRSGAAGRVRSLLLTDVAERLSFATVAKLLKTTPRTLRRHLRLQNTSFRELSDELRVHAALRYLRETTMTIEDIGFALGFSDSANFRHAFRRWTGKAPQDFRREPMRLLERLALDGRAWIGRASSAEMARSHPMSSRIEP